MHVTQFTAGLNILFMAEQVVTVLPWFYHDPKFRKLTRWENAFLSFG